MKHKEHQHVFLIGAKNLGSYGGYETFVNKLTEYHQNNVNIKYHVACKANGTGYVNENEIFGATKISKKEFIYHNARCFKIRIPIIGSAQAIYYDIASIRECYKYIRRQKIVHPIIYIMACRIGPVMSHYYKKIHKNGGRIFVNPDGHEWMREKWSPLVRSYWKSSEKSMILHCDLVVCDSINIEKYIHLSYDKYIQGVKRVNTIFIPYGTDVNNNNIKNNDDLSNPWFLKSFVRSKDYYLAVGRFVPENSFGIMIREFMLSHTKKDFVIVTTSNRQYLQKLEKQLSFSLDKRIKFVGSVYDQELLTIIRKNAYAYIHGHTVGGTNPSLIESLGSTDLNLLINVDFNHEVAEDSAYYWDKTEGDLATLINMVDNLDDNKINLIGKKAKQRIYKEYTWEKVSSQYDNIFCSM
jgi:rhamnosyltransferase